MKSIIFLLLSLLLPYTHEAQVYEGPEEDIQAILANARQFSKYFVEGNMAGIVDSYTENGKIFPTGLEIMSGREELKQYWLRNDDVKAIHHKLTPLSITICGNRATDYGYYEGITQYKDNPPSEWKGKYVVIWEKVDGIWKMEIDIWNHINLPTVEDKFQAVLDSVFQLYPEAVGSIIHVEAPDQHISWTGAVGVSEKNTDKSINVQQAALIASNTKTYVAAAVLRLIEMKKLSLDQPIDKLLTSGSRKQLQKAGYDLKSITVKHLLSHTSGITDYVNADYIQFVVENPKYRWTREEQIKRAAKLSSAMVLPGTAFDYADVNFVLLGEIIEKQMDLPFHIAISQLLKFKELGLNSTWFHTLDAAPTGTASLVHQYVKERGFDSYELDPSWDLYGGGGLATTTTDLALFFQHLFNAEIIKDKLLLQSMTTTMVLPTEESKYCLGVSKIDFEGMEAYYHGGYWGTDAMYIPELNVSIASFTLEKAHRDLNSVVSKKILALIK